MFDDAKGEIAKDQITGGADWLMRSARDAANRYERAAAAGAELAEVVCHFLTNPDAVGTDALEAAYRKFMSLHSGNFYVAPPHNAPVPTP